MKAIEFEAKITLINEWHILRLPSLVSAELPSRGMCMGKLTIGSVSALIPIEPDGEKGHWIHIHPDLYTSVLSQIQENNSIQFQLTPTDQWLDPQIPEDIQQALNVNSLSPTWAGLTAKAKWEWIRWIRFTNNPKTRDKRINTAVDMLSSGKKRPCCFDQSRSTDMHVSRSGKLDYPSSND